MRLIDISEDLAVLPRRISAVKRTGDKCAVFMAADNAVTGGFLVDRDFDDLVKEINDALEDEEYDARRQDGSRV